MSDLESWRFTDVSPDFVVSARRCDIISVFRLFASSPEVWPMYRRMLIVPLAVVVCLASVSLAQAAKPKGHGKTPSKFIRLTRDAKDDPVSMETAIVRYKANDADKGDLIIALIGAVHIGE